MTTSSSSWPRWARLIVAAAMVLATAYGCKRRPEHRKQSAPGVRCPRARVAWQVKTAGAPYLKAGISTRPTGQEDGLMSRLPNLVHQWAKQCKNEGHWNCSAPVIVAFQRDKNGKPTHVSAQTSCVAARCLAAKVAKLHDMDFVTPKTDVCVYLELPKTKNDNRK